MAASAPSVNPLTQNFDKARAEYEAAQMAMLKHADDLERLQKELKKAQQAVLDRERAMVEAALKDGVTATTATAAMVALNPATAAKVHPAARHALRGAVFCRPSYTCDVTDRFRLLIVLVARIFLYINSAAGRSIADITKSEHC